MTSLRESHIVKRLLPPIRQRSWRAALTLPVAFVGIDLRRPASWIALAMGGWLGWWCSTHAAAGGGIAMALAAASTAAAIGDLPLALWAPAGHGRPLWGSLWACERAAWPLVGVLIGMLAAGGGEPQAFEVAPAAMVGSLLAAATTVASRLSGAKAADGATLTLLLAAASGAAGGGLAPWLGRSCVGVAAVWLLLCGLGWAWSRSQKAAIETLLPGAHRAGHAAGAEVLHVDALPADGPLRQTLTSMAMVAALAAMAGWLVLEPAVDPGAGTGHTLAGPAGLWDGMTEVQRAAAAWALLTATWFIGLAVPQATLQDGIAGARSWEGLMRTAATSGHPGPGKVAPWRFFSSPRPGPVRFAGGVAVFQAAILGWPIVVCAVLALPTPAAARLPLAIVMGLAVAAAALTAVVAVGAAVHVSRETIFAATLAVVAGFLAVAADACSSETPTALSNQPSFSSLADPLWRRLRGG